MKVGITGSRGFVGSNLIKHMRFINSTVDKEFYTIEGYKGRISNKRAIREFVERNDVVIHCAADHKGSPEEIIKTNLVDSLWLAYECAAQGKNEKKKLIHVSSTNSTSPSFAFSKRTFDAALTRLNQSYDLDYSIVLCPNIVGLGCRPFYNSFITTLIYLISKNEPHKHLIRDNDVLIDFSFVESVNVQILNAITIKHKHDYFPEFHTMSIAQIVDILTCKKKAKTTAEHYLSSLKESYKTYEIPKKYR